MQPQLGRDKKWTEVQSDATTLPRPGCLCFQSKTRRNEEAAIHKEHSWRGQDLYLCGRIPKEGTTTYSLLTDHDRKIQVHELPNKHKYLELYKYPELYKLVVKHIMHGPCGALNRYCPCIKNCKSCNNNYPKPFIETTTSFVNIFFFSYTG